MVLRLAALWLVPVAGPIHLQGELETDQVLLPLGGFSSEESAGVQGSQ